MSGELRNYDPDKVTATFTVEGSGSIDLTQGLIDGPGAITETKDAPKWTRRGDRQGNMVRIKSSKKGGFLTFVYVAEAEIQQRLSVLSNTDDQLENIVGIITVKDLSGSTIMTYLGAFIENDPSPSFGDTAADRPYVFGYAERVPFLGGASKVP